MSQWVPTSHASLFLDSKFVLQRLKSPISWSSSRRSKSARSSHQKNTWSLISRAAIMLIMLLRLRKRASNNVWPARPHGDLSQRRLFTFSATKGEYVIHVHCIYINIAPLPPTYYIFIKSNCWQCRSSRTGSRSHCHRSYSPFFVICCWQVSLWLFQRWRPSPVDSSACDWWLPIGKMSLPS